MSGGPGGGPGERPGESTRGRPTVDPDAFRTVVSVVLAAGVLTSAGLIAAGFGLARFVGWEGSLTGARSGGAAPADFATIGAGLLALRPVAIAQLGLLVLVATPVVRVAASLVAFGLERDSLYVAITGAVLAVLLASLFLVR
ncbi:MAG TPA: DUF1634 domain-containing protein [Candidatus Limnocylindrales bacterium]